MVAALGQTITIVNKSGKVVKTSQHLVNVFKEAKSAYRERKAEIKAVRDAELEQRRIERRLENMRIEDGRSESSKRSKKTKKWRSNDDKPPLERGYTDTFADEESPRNDGNDALARRYTDGLFLKRSKSSKRDSRDSVDMDLAYGEIPPPLPDHRAQEELELRDKVNGLTALLDEANCVHHSVQSMIGSLEKNPDALAAVALTLAEISTIVTKLGPGALTVLKGSFPAVVALLASPQFMIAAGVGVGVTIVALGGYRIIKKITAKNEEKPLEYGGPVKSIEEGDDRYVLDELAPPELSRIERWRRGIADVAANSVGTNVEHELVTPGAADRFIEEGLIKEDDLKSRRSKKTTRSSKSRKTHKSSKSDKSDTVKSDKERRSKKEPSGLRMLFKSAA
ncbi:hypothetical protein IWZ00DRAFT_52630 [Phyllosticta capitalensis]|uniref:Uncharacterized protein n=1 Tax=Phyllosticta capitalensis TaxID=121624 RepID=A0ABR1YLJ7_9PEZI